MLLVAVEPNLGGVVGLATVDVEEFAGVGYGGDPVCIISQAITELGGGCSVRRDVPVLAAAVSEGDDLRESCVSLIKLEGFVRKGFVRSSECDRSKDS